MVRHFSDVAFREAEAVESAAHAANAPEVARWASAGRTLAMTLPHAPPVNLMTPTAMAETGAAIAHVAAETARATAAAVGRLPAAPPVPVDVAGLVALADAAEERSATISEADLDGTLSGALATVTDAFTAARAALLAIAEAGGLPGEPAPPWDPVEEKRRRWWRRSRV